MQDDLGELAAAARDTGVALAVQSAYRSYQYQVTTYQGWVARSSEKEARKVSARPGHSEHQLGTALDFRSADDATPPWELDDFADIMRLSGEDGAAVLPTFIERRAATERGES